MVMAGFPSLLRTPFGREYEVTACSKFDSHNAEDPQNHFMVVAGNPEAVLATPTE